MKTPPTVNIIRPATEEEVYWAKAHEGANSTDDFDIYDWYMGWVDQKQFLKPKLHDGSNNMSSKKAWKEWWKEEIGPDGARPGSEWLLKGWSGEPSWETQEDQIIVTFKGNLHNIEDGWHRTAVAILRDMPQIPAMIGIEKTSQLKSKLLR